MHPHQKRKLGGARPGPRRAASLSCAPAILNCELKVANSSEEITSPSMKGVATVSGRDKNVRHVDVIQDIALLHDWNSAAELSGSASKAPATP